MYLERLGGDWDAFRYEIVYGRDMAEANRFDFDQTDSILDEEDEATLAAIDRGIKDADDGQTVSAEEVYKRMEQWLSKSSTRKQL